MHHRGVGSLDWLEPCQEKCPGVISGIREWFRWYKTPDGKPLNAFGYEEKALDKKFALEVIEETHDAWKKLRDGVFKARMRPLERAVLRAWRDEQRNVRKYGIARFNKRWRSWAQNRVRQFRFPLPDTSLMDATYVMRCVQKAASLRKHDVKLWFGYSKRLLELRDELTAEQLGYVLWGYGKSSFVDANFYQETEMTEMLPVVKLKLQGFQSHALMSLMWCLKRLKWYDAELNRRAAQHSLEIIEHLRPSDFIKVANALAQLGLQDELDSDSLDWSICVFFFHWKKYVAVVLEARPRFGAFPR
eukprot:g21481.t1